MKFNFLSTQLIDKGANGGGSSRNKFGSQHSGRQWLSTLGVVLVATGLAVGLAPEAIANPAEPAAELERPIPSEQTRDAGAVSIPVAVTTEIDTSISRDYTPAIVYLHDPVTHELTPQSVLVTTDEPVEGAVSQIVSTYEGQDIGITGYHVSVDEAANEAEIDFDIQNPRGATAFNSLSSANQFSLFEAIRETLLTQPMYDVDQVIFMANGAAFDI